VTKRQQDRAKRAAAIMAAAALLDGWLPAGPDRYEARRAALARWRGQDEDKVGRE